jgi:hypothetical protein
VLWAPKGGEGKSFTTIRLEKAGAAAHAQKPGTKKLVKVAVGGKLHRREENTHNTCEL